MEEFIDDRGKAIALLGRLHRRAGGRGMAIAMRGESDWFEEVSSQLWREHKSAGVWPQQVGVDFDAIEEEIAKEILEFTERPSESTAKIIAELEVAGGKTNQINFTYSIGVAVWFACQEPKDKDGRVIMVQRNAARNRFAPRAGAPRQGPVLFSDPSGKIPDTAIAGVERIPAGLKDELLRVIARTDGLWEATVFSGEIQSVAGFATIQRQRSTALYTIKRLQEIENTIKLEADMRDAALMFARNRAAQKSNERPGGATDTNEESVAARRNSTDPTRTKLKLMAMRGIEQEAIGDLKGEIFMDTGKKYHLQLREDGIEKGVTIGRFPRGTRGLLQMWMPGWRTDRLWDISAGIALEVELIRWGNGETGSRKCSVQITFIPAEGGEG